MDGTRIRIQAKILAVQETGGKMKPEQGIVRLVLKMLIKSNTFKAHLRHPRNFCSHMFGQLLDVSSLRRYRCELCSCGCDAVYSCTLVSTLSHELFTMS